MSQLSFFCCPNVFYNKEIKKDVERYIYCQENNVTPYQGSYGEQPASWVDKYFSIKNAYAKKEQIQIDKNKQQQNMQQTKGFSNG